MQSLGARRFQKVTDRDEDVIDIQMPLKSTPTTSALASQKPAPSIILSKRVSITGPPIKTAPLK